MSTCFTLKTPPSHTAMQITNIHQPMTGGLGRCESCVIEQLNARLTPVSQRLLGNPTGRQYPVLAVTRRDLQSASGLRHMQTHNRMSLSLKSTKDEATDNELLVTSDKHDANIDNTITRKMRQTPVYEESSDNLIMNDSLEIDQIQNQGISKTSLTPPDDSLLKHEESNIESEYILHDPDKLDMSDVMKMVNKKMGDRDTGTQDSHKGKIHIKFNMKPSKTKRTPMPSGKTFKPTREGSTRRQKSQSGSHQGFTMITKSKTTRKLDESRINLDNNNLKYPRTVSSYSVTNSSLWNDRVAQQKHRLNILNSQTKSVNKTIKGSLDKDIHLKTHQIENTGEEGKHSIHKHASPHCVPLLFDEMSSHLPEPHSFWGEYSPGRTSPRTAATIAFKRGLIQPDECIFNNWHCGRKRIPPLPQGGAPGLPRLDLLDTRDRSHNVARLHMKTGRTTRENSLMSDLKTKNTSMNNLDAKKDLTTNFEDKIPENIDQVPDFSVDTGEPFTPANTPISWQYYSDEPESAFANSMTVSDYKENKAEIHIFLPEMS